MLKYLYSSLYFLAVLCCFLCGCNKMPKVYFFGDSITKGERAGSPNLRWTTLLSEKRAWKEINYGKSGELMDSTGMLSFQNRYRSLIKERSSLDKYIFLAYGTNDANFNDGIKNVMSFKDGYGKVVTYAKAKGWPDSAIIIIGGYYISNYSPYKFKSDSNRHRQYINAAREVALLYHVKFIDLDSAMRKEGATRLLSNDHVHPNDSGYATIAHEIDKFLN